MRVLESGGRVEWTMIEPYYEHAGITIYHGDCRDIITHVEADVVLTDTPYGLGRLTGMHKGSNDYASYDDTYENVRDVIIPTVCNIIGLFGCVVVTPGNRHAWLYPQPDSLGCFYMPAATSVQRFGNLDAQPILYYGRPHRKSGPMGHACSWKLTERAVVNGHPCPKPERAWRMLLATVSCEASVILDPFMGSGTTLVAAKELGRKAIGIEIEEKYCEIAAKRLSQEVLPFFQKGIK